MFWLTLKKLTQILTSSERKQVGGMLVMILIMALLDMLGVASIMPYMAVVSNPDIIQSNEILNKVFIFSKTLGLNTPDQFLIALGFLVFVLLVFSLAFKAFTTYLLTRFSLMREYSIGKRLLSGYLNQPYSWFLNRHSSDLNKSILSEVNILIHSGFIPMFTLLAQGATAIIILILLLFLEPLIAISAAVFLGFVYFGIFTLMGGLVKGYGDVRLKANQDRFTGLSEAFGAFKEVKLGGLERHYLKLFADPSKDYARSQAVVAMIGQLPRYLLEAIAFGGMLIVVIYLTADRGSFVNAIPTVSLFAFAGYKLIPSIQQIYGALTSLRYVGPALNAIHSDLRIFKEKNAYEGDIKPLLLTKNLQLCNVSFKYPNTHSFALNSINLDIKAKSIIGLVGSTGSGKTTMVDVILGLLEPIEGCLKVDDQPLSCEDLRNWQATLGYVPQNIYLADDSIANNISFGKKPEDRDMNAVERASKAANLHDFVINDLPQGYATNVGERGVRLSGGQRQRIGIARALYNNPQVLILDEATSALDNLTEKAVMEAVNNLGHEITIVMIAHRLSTVRQCDQIYLLERGEVLDSGTYEQLAARSDLFKSMT